MSTFLIASLLSALAVAAAVSSIEWGLAAAIIEIGLGVIAGNFFGIHTTPWIDFLASFGGIYLTFLAGTEVDVPIFKQNWKEALLIGGFSFFAPLAGTLAFAYWGLHWTLEASKIAGIALSTTSLAVVYAVLVESGLSATELGKRIMAATFVTDILTVIALTALFVKFNVYTFVFAAVSVFLIFLFPKIFSWFVGRYNGKVIQPEIKLLFLAIFILMWLGESGNAHAGLPIFLLGLVMSGFLSKNPDLQKKMRVVGFAIVTPFFFLKGGMNVALRDVYAGLAAMSAFLGIKLVTKFAGVFPFARKYHVAHGMFTTLLMSTGLTFGTITSLYGLSKGIITTSQFSILITVVILSAILPTVIAQRFFSPLTKEQKEVVITEGEEG